ncbi:hypothetical protein AB832_04590 [Flavobacteriaceae bacterium (ex Bugula neritina AB1)]|nr:hypothetical protein AB832_04590 [Flavobacteriaceae bacterium (ex Bugula neritina AB1)]
MKKLTKEDIQFIDSYLSNADIHYEDIRIELIDHVASEIEHRMNTGDERGFYYIFKDYMVENKTSLEKQGKPYSWKVFKSVWEIFISNLFSIKSIIGGVFLFIGFWLLNNFLYEIDAFLAMMIPWIFLTIISVVPALRLNKKRYSFLGNLGLFDSFFFWFGFQVLGYLENNSVSFYIIMGAMCLFSAASFNTMFYLITFYKKRFQSI